MPHIDFLLWELFSLSLKTAHLSVNSMMLYTPIYMDMDGGVVFSLPIKPTKKKEEDYLTQLA